MERRGDEEMERRKGEKEKRIRVEKWRSGEDGMNGGKEEGE